MEVKRIIRIVMLRMVYSGDDNDNDEEVDYDDGDDDEDDNDDDDDTLREVSVLRKMSRMMGIKMLKMVFIQRM